MKRLPKLLTVAALMACCAPVFSGAAKTISHASVEPKSAHGRTVPLRHDQLTLYPHGKPAHRQSPYGSGSAYNRFNHRSPIHNTFMGVQRW